MAFTYSWPEPYPPEGGFIRDGNDQIRDGWAAIRERLAVDHQFFQDEDGQSNIGKHKQVSFIEAADIGVGAEGLPILGAQTVGGKAELVFTNEDDVDIQITSGAALKSSVPSGLIGMWSGTIALIPSGFSLCDGDGSTPNLTDKMIRGVASGADPGTTGGSDTHTHASGTYAGPSHTHTGTTDAKNSASALDYTYGEGVTNYIPTSHTHTFTTGAGGTGSVTGASAAGSTLPAYYALAFIMKD